jgi:hypothetical protein
VSVVTLAFWLATKAKGLQGCGPNASPGVKPRGSPGVKARRSSGVKAIRSLGVTSHTLGSVRKSEGVNPHTPKATPTLRDGVSMDSQKLKEQF